MFLLSPTTADTFNQIHVRNCIYTHFNYVIRIYF